MTDEETPVVEYQRSMYKFKGVMYEQLENGTFVYFDNKDIIRVCPYVDLGVSNGKEVRVIPINNKTTQEKIIPLPTWAEEYKTTTHLIKDIYDFSYKYLDVTEKFRKMCSWYIPMSWITDNLNTINYLRSLGDFGQGKTRYLDVVGMLCYKPIPMGGATNPAPIYRLMDMWKGTMVFDEFVLGRSDEATDIIQILNSGIQRGKPVWRCNPNDVTDVIPFQPFGPKVISARKPFNDNALESRCINENIKKTTRKDIPIELPRDFYKEQQTIRNKLLLFRLRNWNKINDSSLTFKLPDVNPRLKQMLLPFFITYDNFKDIKKDLNKFGEEYYDEQLNKISLTIEGGIVRSILELYLIDKNVSITSTDILNKCKELGYETGNMRDVSIGIRRANMGIGAKQSMIKGKSSKHIVWDSDIMRDLIKTYIPRKEHEYYEVIISSFI